jgi:hypothetical protein
LDIRPLMMLRTDSSIRLLLVTFASGGASHDNSGAVTDTAHRPNMELSELQHALDSENKKRRGCKRLLRRKMANT